MRTSICHPIYRRLALVAGAALVLSLAACGTTNWGFPYRATVQQGNWITAEQVAQLEVGMTRAQVRFLLGSPTLTDALHADRWDYPYYNQPGYGKDELRNFTVWFENDHVVRWAGDSQPDRQPYEKVDPGKIDATAHDQQSAPAAEPVPEADAAAGDAP